jgi:hypothetical protein
MVLKVNIYPTDFHIIIFFSNQLLKFLAEKIMRYLTIFDKAGDTRHAYLSQRMATYCRQTEKWVLLNYVKTKKNTYL